MIRYIVPKAIRGFFLLVFLLLLAACGNYTTIGSTLSNSLRGVDRTPEPGAIAPAGTSPVITASITFKAWVSYVQARRLVTDLGLQITSGCGPDWVSTDFRGSYDPSSGSELPIASTAAAAPGWLARLRASGDVVQIGVNQEGHCSNSAWALLTQPATLSPEQSSSFMRITFSRGISYDSALNTISMLGFRLANPCYEYLRALNQKPIWTPMGQEAFFAASHALLLATTPSNAISWKQQLSTTPGVTKVEIAPPIAC
jgi:hypothetical protein